MYRGTQGTEVAYLLRNLLDRLDLIHRPEKLRVLATSASLERDRDQQFIEGFFAQPIDRFDIWTGEAVDSRARSRGPEPARRPLRAAARDDDAEAEQSAPRSSAWSRRWTGRALPRTARPAARSIDDIGEHAAARCRR